MHTDLLQDLAIILAVAGVVMLLFHRIRQPVVLGFILAGMIVGPNTPPFPLVHDRHTVEMLSELGVIMLMFGLGLHFSLRKLAKVGATALIASVLEIVLLAAAGFACGRAFGWSPMDSLFLGAILSISSTTIIIKALQDLKLVKAPFANVVFGILIVEDILAIAMLALLSGIATTGSLNAGDVLLTLGKLSLFLVVTLVAGLIFVPGIIRYVDRFESREMLLIVVLALCFGVSLIALKLGYSVALGAFLIGAIVAETREHAKIETLIEPVRDMFGAVFFVAIGMLIDPRMLWEYALPIAVITLVVVVGKVVACSIGAFVGGHDRPTSLRIGMSLAQIGEFSFIIAALGRQLKVTSDFLYPLAVAVSVITTLLTPYLIRSSDAIAQASDRLAPRRIAAGLDLYTVWVSRLARPSGAAPRMHRIFLKWGIQIALNFALLTALLIGAAWAGRLRNVQEFQVPPWTGGTGTLVWLLGIILGLPLVIAILRKLRAMAMGVAEISVSRAAAGKHVVSVRAFITNVIVILGSFGLLLWMLILTAAILPPLPVLILLAVFVAFIGFLTYRSLIKVHASAQIKLSEALAELPPLPPVTALAPIPELSGAQLHVHILTDGDPAGGKLIRELGIRTETGASVVAIDRDQAPIINPGPDEELRSGDRLYLLGTPEQITRAAGMLSTRA